MKHLSTLFTLFTLFFPFILLSQVDPLPPDLPPDQVSFRCACSSGTAQIDLDVNNVRARLRNAGDLWWDGEQGLYVVPNVPQDEAAVSAAFASSFWIAGKDPGGNIKVAAQTYDANTPMGYYPGPLYVEEYFCGNGPCLWDQATTDTENCANWDQIFTVYKTTILEHIKNWKAAVLAGQDYLDPSLIDQSILGWPARQNPFFESVHQFSIANWNRAFASYYDQNLNNVYEPHLGDYPITDMFTACSGLGAIPDQISFWMLNDVGSCDGGGLSGISTRHEIHVEALAYKREDAVNDMTFYQYKTFNRSIERLDSTYFGFWMDPDLGCHTDDFIGCDPDRNLMYVYNSDALDGTAGCNCDTGLNSYCDEVPIFAIDMLQGPLTPVYGEGGAQIGEKELKMSSFTYYNGNQPVGLPDQQTRPTTPSEYFNYLSGKWRDGSPLTYGGDGYMTGEPHPYAFPDPPNDPDGWSMCSENASNGDYKMLMSAGPFTSLPGAVNKMKYAAMWVPDMDYPCPNLDRLYEANDLMGNLVLCLDLARPIDAPDVDWIELDQEIVAVFSNDEVFSNNANETYAEMGIDIPDEEEDRFYRFEGYKLFQFSGPEVSLADVDDPTKVRLVYQVDKKNGVGQIFNWQVLNPEENETPTSSFYYEPKLMVNGADEGIRHTFSIKEDQFAEGDRRLVNHKKYYFVAVAYAHNNYKAFDPNAAGYKGQQTPYIESTRNIGDGENAHYTVIPRKILDRQLMSVYGEGVPIVRIDGVGTGTANFLDIADATRDEIETLIRDDNATDFSDEISYKAGFGPIDINIFNPLDVVDGEYELTFTDDDMEDDELDTPAFWTLRNLSDPAAPVITADKPIDDLNEQIIKEYGFSVRIAQVNEPASDPFNDPTNGVIGYTEEYHNPDARPWLFGVPDGLLIPTGNNVTDVNVYDYLATTNIADEDYELDPNQALSSIGNGFFVPYYLCDWRQKENGAAYLSPAWKNAGNQNSIVRAQTDLEDLNNVDIVFTKDKSLWSRCVIVETASPDHEDIIGATPVDDYIVGEAKMFDLRQSPSVSKEAGPDGLPLPDAHPAAGEEIGMGWFPGYAIDVETGQRLNIYFGENSAFNTDLAGSSGNGADMMFNPSDEYYIPPADATQATILNYPAAGQHFVYVTKQPYDGCALELDQLGTGNIIRKLAPLREVTWAGFIGLAPGASMLSYADGLIPEDVTVKLRVNNPYAVAVGTNDFNGYPTYRFKLEGKQAQPLDAIGEQEALTSINVVPNPYYGFSQYESGALESIVKITNLPAKCTVSIYTVDGQFVRTFQRNEVAPKVIGNNRAIEQSQILPDLEWDLKNFKGMSVASGVYLIHVSAPDLGERTLKWFGVGRKLG